MRKRVLSLLLVLILSLTLLAACGPSAEEKEAAEKSEFLLGTWVATTAEYDGTTVDAHDVFDGTFILIFKDNGDCSMFVDTDQAIVKWVMNDDGSVTLTGDDTYTITFPDDSQTTMIVDVHDVNVTMEKDLSD